MNLTDNKTRQKQQPAGYSMQNKKNSLKKRKIGEMTMTTADTESSAGKKWED